VVDPSLFPPAPKPQGDSDPSIFLQRDEIPYAIVQAYEQAASFPAYEQAESIPAYEPPLGDPESAPPPVEQPESTWSPPDLGEPLDDEPPDLLLDPGELDDTVPLGGLGGDEYFSTPYPLGQDMVVGKKRPKRRLRLWVGVGLLAILIASLVFLAGKCATRVSWQEVKKLGREALSMLPLNRLDSGKIQISDLSGRFQERARKEPSVFVIEGKVTNRHESPCHSIQVKGILFDERGNPAAEKVVYCGNVLTASQIKSQSRKKIEQSLQNAYGSTLSNFNIEPGKSVPFMLIFFDPPAKLSEFSLEVDGYTLQERSGE
jgi:hypothetical protein